MIALTVGTVVTLINPTPAHANHANYHGHWNQPPLVESPFGNYAANIQDAAYYWQDVAFFRGYYPPLPNDQGYSGCLLLTGRISICEINRWTSPLNGNNGIAQVERYETDSNKHIRAARIYIANDMGLNPLLKQITYRHEFGHALGLDHRAVGPGHGWTNTLMSPDANTPYADQIDKEAIYLWQPWYHYH